MIETSFSEIDCADIDREHEILQQYVHAMLARQKALDLLETIQQQINQVWAVMRRLLEYPRIPGATTKAVRTARAAQAVQAQNTYRALEKRREDCIASLHQAERHANAALQTMLVTQPQLASRKKPGSPLSLRARSNDPLACRNARRRLKNAFSGSC